MIMSESVKRGNVEEIKLTQAILILRRSERLPAACVLVASRPSRALRDALDGFARRFFEEYSEQFAHSSNISLFAGATQFIEEYFPFVPEYD